MSGGGGGGMFGMIGNAFGTTTRVGGTIGGVMASNRAARAERRNAGEMLGYAQSKEDSALGYLDPYAGAGEQALSPLSGLLTGKQYNPETGEYDAISEDQRMDLFKASPGYQFRLDQSQKAIENSQAARGGLFSGRAATELGQHQQGLASDEYSNYINQLYQLSTMGKEAATNQSSIVSGNAGALTNLYGRSMDSAYQAQKWQNISKGWQEGSESVAQNHENSGKSLDSMFGGMSDRHLKKNIEMVGKSESGIPIYHFEYKDKKYGRGRFEGVMAQDLLSSNPDAVLEIEGYLAVDYNKIDVIFRKL